MSFRLSARTCLVAGLICLQLADLICTYLLLEGGQRLDVYEANPLARTILDGGGWVGMTLFKLSMTAVVVSAVLLLSRRRPAVAVRLLAVLCVLMLGVNGYSATLLASPDADALEQRQAVQYADRLEHQLAVTREFYEIRTSVVDSVLDDECEMAEATSRLAEAIESYGPRLKLPKLARLPDPSRNDEVAAYLTFHVRERAIERGLQARLATPVAHGEHDHLTPLWMHVATE